MFVWNSRNSILIFRSNYKSESWFKDFEIRLQMIIRINRLESLFTEEIQLYNYGLIYVLSVLIAKALISSS
jgi:hypothetical protein